MRMESDVAARVAHLSATDQAAVDAAVRYLREQWPVVAIALFGSKARGDDGPESDIDLLVLTSRDLTWPERGELQFEIVELAVRHEVYIQAVVEPAEAWHHGVLQAAPIHEAVTREGIWL